MKSTSIAIIVAALLIGGAILWSKGGGSTTEAASTGNVSLVDGKQIVAVNIQGDYAPKLTAAKAGMPTTLRMKSTGVISCALALVIPSIGYRKNLALDGSTDIELPPYKAGETLRGICAMGMYSFAVRFE